MAKIISVTNQKGGCGKTTTTINLSSMLASKGYNVLAIDIDHQADLTKVLGDEEIKYNFHCGSLIEDNKLDVNKCIYGAVSDGEDIKGLSFIPSHISLSRVVEQSSMKAHKEKILYKHLANVKDSYDYIIFDCPPNLSLGFMNAVYLSDYFLIPVDGGKFALDGLSDLLEAIAEVKEMPINEINYYVFRNEYAVNNKLINDFIDDELENIKNNVLNSKIRRSESVGQASVTSMPLNFYSNSSKAVDDYSALCDELLGIIQSKENTKVL